MNFPLRVRVVLVSAAMLAFPFGVQAAQAEPVVLAQASAPAAPAMEKPATAAETPAAGNPVRAAEKPAAEKPVAENPVIAKPRPVVRARPAVRPVRHVRRDVYRVARYEVPPPPVRSCFWCGHLLILGIGF